MKIRQNRNRKTKEPTAKTAAVYAIYINLLISLLFMVMLFYGRSALVPYTENHEPHPPFNVLIFVVGLLSTYMYVFMLLWINFSILKAKRYSGAATTLLAIFTSFLFVIFWNQISLQINVHLFGIPIVDERVIVGRFFRDLVIGSMAVFTSRMIFVNYRRQLVLLENEMLKAEYERARYGTLKSQIDPHFLFNALNTLNSVIVVDQEKARRYVQKMSSILRYTIQSRDISTLDEELVFARDYCTLMQLRYGENLSFVFDVLPKYNYYTVVPFGVQTLIENAIKHNIITDRQPLTITISTDTDDFVVVSNPLHPKKEPEKGEGIGLANLSERYRLKFGRDVEIYNDGNVFKVRLPLIHGGNNTK